MTLFDIVSSIYETAKDSSQINGVVQGSRNLFNNELRYPCFTLDQGVHSIPKDGFIDASFSLFYVDRLFDETRSGSQDYTLDNEYIIQSRGINVFESLFEQFTYPVVSRNYTPFTQQYQDYCAGVRADVVIRIPYTYCLDTYGTVDRSFSAVHGTTSISTYHGWVGDQVSVSVTPDSGYHFSGWSDGSYDNPRVFTIDANISSYTAYCTDELMFTARQAGSTVALSQNGTYTGSWPVEYSLNGGEWQSYSVNPSASRVIITLADVGDFVCFRGVYGGTAQSNNIYRRFMMTGSIDGSGNVSSLFDNGANTITAVPDYGLFRLFYFCSSLVSAPTFGSFTSIGFHGCDKMYASARAITSTPDFSNITSLGDYACSDMFNACSALTSASDLQVSSIPDYGCMQMFNKCTVLVTAPSMTGVTSIGKQGCYSMFYRCSSLATAPALPATTLAEYCYSAMFQSCTSLTTPPALPATTLAMGCYNSMFSQCTSLTSAPDLSATTLTNYCYYQMFQGCTSLATAPSLPATTLASDCYNGMFGGCTSLTSAPVLPATTLVSSCYRSMFSGCSSLREVHCAATDISASSCTSNWLYNVSSTGDFYTPASTSWTTGISGIPTNWTRHDE